MKSRIYSSKFYPTEYFSLIITAPNDIFYDLEKSNADRIAYQKARVESRQRMSNSQNFFIANNHLSKASTKQNKVASVKLIGDGSKFRTTIQGESESIKKISGTRRSKTTIFSLVYENGDKRNVEVFNGSNLFRFLMSQCRHI